jgi:hypothetical protein
MYIFLYNKALITNFTSPMIEHDNVIFAMKFGQILFLYVITLSSKQKYTHCINTSVSILCNEADI